MAWAALGIHFFNKLTAALALELFAGAVVAVEEVSHGLCGGLACEGFFNETPLACSGVLANKPSIRAFIMDLIDQASKDASLLSLAGSSGVLRGGSRDHAVEFPVARVLFDGFTASDDNVLFARNEGLRKDSGSFG